MQNIAEKQVAGCQSICGHVLNEVLKNIDWEWVKVFIGNQCYDWAEAETSIRI